MQHTRSYLEWPHTTVLSSFVCLLPATGSVGLIFVDKSVTVLSSILPRIHGARLRSFIHYFILSFVLYYINHHYYYRQYYYLHQCHHH